MLKCVLTCLNLGEIPRGISKLYMTHFCFENVHVWKIKVCEMFNMGSMSLYYSYCKILLLTVTLAQLAFTCSKLTMETLEQRQ